MSIMDINQQTQPQPQNPNPNPNSNSNPNPKISNDLLEALAVQKALKDKETAKRALALAMNSNPKTVVQQNEDAMRTTSLSEVTDGVAGVLKKRNADATQNLNRAATSGLPQAGANMQLAAGGIIGYASGQTVERELTEKEKEEIYQAKLSGKIPTGNIKGSTITGDSTTPILSGPPGAPKVNLGQVQEQRAGPYMNRNTTYSISQYMNFVQNDPNLNAKQKKEKLALINQMTDQTPEKRKSLDPEFEQKFPQFSKFGRLGERKGTIDQPRDVAEMQRQLNFQIANKYKSKEPFDAASGQTMGQKNEIKRDAGPGGGILNQGENLNKAYSAIANKFGLKDPNAPTGTKFNAEGIREPSFPEGLAAAEKFKKQARMDAMPNDLGTRDTSTMVGSKQPRSADVTPKVAPEGIAPEGIAAAGGKGNYDDYMNVLLRTMAGNRQEGGMGLAYADAVDAIKKRDADKTSADLDRELLRDSNTTKNRILDNHYRNQDIAKLMQGNEKAVKAYVELLNQMKEASPELTAAKQALSDAENKMFGPSASGIAAAQKSIQAANQLILQQMAQQYPNVVANVKGYKDAIATLNAKGQKNDVTELMKQFNVGG